MKQSASETSGLACPIPDNVEVIDWPAARSSVPHPPRGPDEDVGRVNPGHDTLGAGDRAALDDVRQPTGQRHRSRLSVLRLSSNSTVASLLPGQRRPT